MNTMKRLLIAACRRPDNAQQRRWKLLRQAFKPTHSASGRLHDSKYPSK